MQIFQGSFYFNVQFAKQSRCIVDFS